ncbi:hypothetical protein L211DRAFT_847381 [Terfezia boudieri ATCC MYA-4762]|uniref:Uncharacterized protein n=1 Tax=Terfezia boudieri ATCC MYA-4762 TaxID=1051890 RepID=A0A3N4M8J4_9PEZI|nr:hypothetical protein L211DRAFT_847381 [Terfezia boudieri ATCC MYA-4762]
MSAINVQTNHCERLRSPKLVLRSTNRAQGYPKGGYREPIHIRRHRADPKTLCPESEHDDYGHQHRISLSTMKGRLVPRSTRCDSEYDCDYGTPSNNSSSRSPGIIYQDSCSSSSSSSVAGGVDIFEVSPSRPGFVMSPGVSPGHAMHHTEQQGYFSATPSRQNSPYNTLRSGVRYLPVHSQVEAWSEELDRGDEVDLDHSEEEDENENELGDRNPDYWAEEGDTRYSDPGYACAGQQSQHYRYQNNAPVASGPAPPRKTTTPTGTIRVNGEIVNAALPKRRTPAPPGPTPQSAFFGFNPTPRSQRAPSSTGTGTVLRRGLHRHQQRRHSEGDTDGHIHGPTQDECRQCNGEGCVRSLAVKEFMRKRDQEGRMAGHPDTWGPSVRDLMRYHG